MILGVPPPRPANLEPFGRAAPPSRGVSSTSPAGPPEVAQSLRPWIGVRFLCAGQYLRVYRNKGGDAYLAGCPRCGRTVRFRVGDGGIEQRFFDVSC